MARAVPVGMASSPSTASTRIDRGPNKIWLKITNLSAPGVLRLKDQTLGLALIT
jgi:hypothetical protein